MATFIMPNNTANTQYFAETIIIGSAQNKSEFLSELQLLQKELNQAIDSKLITGENAVDAEMHVKKAVLQAQENHPDKKTLVSHSLPKT